MIRPPFQIQKPHDPNIRPGLVLGGQVTIEHAFVLCPGQVIQIQHLPARLVNGAIESGTAPSQQADKPLGAMIREALTRNCGDRTKTARELGMHRTTLWRKMRRLNIDLP